MTTNNEEIDNDNEPVVVPAEARISFARKNDLVKMMKKIDRSVDKAVEFLEQVMMDEKSDQKLRIQAAQFILDKRQSLSESIAKDQLARSLAESRLVIAERSLTSKRIKDVTDEDDDEGFATPKYCPEMILDASAIKSM